MALAIVQRPPFGGLFVCTDSKNARSWQYLFCRGMTPAVALWKEVSHTKNAREKREHRSDI